MRIILEKSDIIKLLSKALESELDPESVEITAEPFEAIISKAEKILQPPLPPPPSPPPVNMIKEGMTRPYRADEVDIEDLVKANSSMVQEGPKRPLGSNERSTPPPPTRGGREE